MVTCFTSVIAGGASSSACRSGTVFASSAATLVAGFGLDTRDFPIFVAGPRLAMIEAGVGDIVIEAGVGDIVIESVEFAWRQKSEEVEMLEKVSDVRLSQKMLEKGDGFKSVNTQSADRPRWRLFGFSVALCAFSSGVVWRRKIVVSGGLVIKPGALTWSSWSER